MFGHNVFLYVFSEFNSTRALKQIYKYFIKGYTRQVQCIIYSIDYRVELELPFSRKDFR